MSLQSDTTLTQAYSLIELGEIEQAKALLEDALPADIENQDLVFAILCCNFWCNVISSSSQLEPFEQGESYILQWKNFQNVILKDSEYLPKTVYAFKKAVFMKALEDYKTQIDESNPPTKAEIYRKIGLCYKKLGSYENALQFLTEANSFVSGNACIIAEMADCYALCGEDKMAKVLFREAFFTDAQRIDLSFLDSPLINVLIEQVMAKGYSGKVLLEWIPVYGVLLGVFSIKRELRSQESCKLKQEIYSRENELKDPSNDSTVIIPRLLNLYFWLIDHYVILKESASKINEVLLKIKILDSSVYSLYVK